MSRVLLALLFFCVQIPICGADETSSVDLTNNLSLLEKERQMRDELEGKIQRDILDPILGQGKAMVFVTLQLDVVTAREKLVQSGSGVSAKSEGQKNKLFADTEYVLPGIPKSKKLENEDEMPVEGRSQQAKQEQGQEKTRVTQKTVIRNLEIVLLHDERITKDVMDMVRDRIVTALRQFKVKQEQVITKPIKMQGKWLDDLRRPQVYIPTLFALLLLLFLMFLFGPVSSAMRGYVRTLERSVGPQISVDSEFKGAEGAGGGGGVGGIGGMGMGGAIEGEIDGGKTEKTPEELEEEKLFAYINDDNLGRLIYLLKREEAWVTAVALNYLKPEQAQKVLGAMPPERQAQVAIETATIRQLSREQVIAINKDIQQRVNYVIGGITPLIQMLEESDPQNMEIILEYLKNEKPEIYEKVRKRLILFEDIVDMPDRVVATVFRELKPVEIAKAVKGTAPELEKKVFSNMSSGASNLVKEEMELLGEVSAEEVVKERQKITNAVKRLEAEGKINFREKPPEGVLEGVEEDVNKAMSRQKAWEEKRKALEGAKAAESAPAAPQVSAAPAGFYDQGVALYGEGRYNEAADAFAKAIEASPDSWESFQYLGGCYYALGQFQEALYCYERVLEANPSEEMRAFVQNMKVEAGVA